MSQSPVSAQLHSAVMVVCETAADPANFERQRLFSEQTGCGNAAPFLLRLNCCKSELAAIVRSSFPEPSRKLSCHCRNRSAPSRPQPSCAPKQPIERRSSCKTCTNGLLVVVYPRPICATSGALRISSRRSENRRAESEDLAAAPHTFHSPGNSTPPTRANIALGPYFGEASTVAVPILPRLIGRQRKECDMPWGENSETIVARRVNGRHFLLIVHESNLGGRPPTSARFAQFRELCYV